GFFFPMLSMMDIILPGPKPLIFDVRQSGSSPLGSVCASVDGKSGMSIPRFIPQASATLSWCAVDENCRRPARDDSFGAIAREAVII
ncbi:hypothetical protein, partial [Streptomyces olivaceoviridis]|uniref:hypothetical protein n=1 Tax=Streptomyces olivaceoviridis TaxID=1921 RepID=UPI003406296C